MYVWFTVIETERFTGMKKHIYINTDYFHIIPLNAELNPTCHLLALLRAYHILHVSRIRVNDNQYAIKSNLDNGKEKLYTKSCPDLERI
jgi:hypothetical protein